MHCTTQTQDTSGILGKQVHLGADSKQGYDGKSCLLCSGLPGDAVISCPDTSSKSSWVASDQGCTWGEFLQLEGVIPHLL